VPLYLVK